MQFQRPVMRQEQKLKMTPQLYQSIKMMAMQVQDLKLTIQEELEKNPALEVFDDKAPESLESIEKNNSQELDYFENSSDPGHLNKSNNNSDGDSKRRFLEGALSRPETLQDHLLWQLRLQPVGEKVQNYGQLLVQNLDEDGFNIVAPEKLLKNKADKKYLDKAAAIIRKLEPAGTCTDNYIESLLVQAAARPDKPEGVETIISDYMGLFERDKLKEISRKLKISLEAVEEHLAFIKTLNPFPGREYAPENVTYVVPDLMVSIREGEFVLVLNDEQIPVLGVNPFFTELLDNTAKSKEKELKSYVNSNLNDARLFIRSLKQRDATLLRVGKAIVEYQKEFFTRGPKYLAPLALKDIAVEVDLHEATISRITTNKYIQTEYGIFELKHFFSNSVPKSSSDGRTFSKEGVKEVMREILGIKGASGHLSDQKIADLLERRGIKLARRTVAKYRKEMDIMSSYDR